MKRVIFIVVILGIVSFPMSAFAQVVLTEIMYDVEGTDDKREWVEVYNDGGEPVDITDWRFSDGTNHTLVISDDKGGQGTLLLAPGSYAIIASDAKVFLSEHSGFTATVIDTVMSLNNSADTLALLDIEKALRDSVSYTSDQGGAGDGKTLQKAAAAWVAAPPSPGAGSTSETQSSAGQETATTTGSTTSAADTSTPPSITRDTPPVPAMRASIRAEERAIVGADAFFKAELVGMSGALIPNARFLWNFGDGTVAEGGNVRQLYRHPGRYVVVLEAASGEFSVSARSVVSAVPADLTLSAIPAAKRGFIEIRNNGKYDINLSQWQLSVDGAAFALPHNTVILNGSAVAFPQETTNLAVREGSTAMLLYPNGELAYQALEKGDTAESASGVLSQQGEQQHGAQAPGSVAAGPIIALSLTKQKAPTPVIQGPEPRVTARVPERAENSESSTVSNESQSARVPDTADMQEQSGTPWRWLAGVLGMVVLASFAALSFARVGGNDESDESAAIAILDD